MKLYFTVSNPCFRRLKTDGLACGFNVFRAAPFLNSKYQFRRQEKTQITVRDNTSQMISWPPTTVKILLSRWRKHLISLIILKLWATCHLGDQNSKSVYKLTLLAYETECGVKKMEVSLWGRASTDCYWHWLWRTRYTISRIKITYRRMPADQRKDMEIRQTEDPFPPKDLILYTWRKNS